MQIIGGKVTFGRTVQPAQYESKKAEVEIQFTLAEGEAPEGKAEAAAKLAMDVALRMVGLKADAAPAAVPGNKEAAAQRMNEADKAAAPATPVPEKRKPGRPPKIEQAPEPAKDTAAVTEPERAVSQTPEDRKDPAQEVAIDDPLDVPAAAVTDADLMSAVQKHNAAVQNPTAIRELITKYVGKTPCKAVDIPAATRGQFLEELKTIGKP